MLLLSRLVAGAVLGAAALAPVLSCRPASAPAESAASSPPTTKKGPMGAAEFEALLEKCSAELSVKQNGHAARWGFGKYARWDMLQGSGELTFTDPVRGEAVTPAQIIGTWFEDDGTWMWSWDNASCDGKLKRDAERVRQFGEEHKLTLLTQAKSTIPEAEAWRLTALAVYLCKAHGVYRGPAGATAVFMSFGEVRRTPAPPTRTDDE